MPRAHSKKWLSIGLALGISGLAGCATINSGLPGGNSPIVRAYGRNRIVQVPTAVGNVTGFVIAAPIYLSLSKVAPETAGYVAAGPVYLFGGITGTPFLPFAFLEEEETWCFFC